MAETIETRPMIDGKFQGKSILSIDQFSREDIETVLNLTYEMDLKLHAKKMFSSPMTPQFLSGFVLKAVMFEDSSRTSDSYLSAAAYLGATPLQPNIATSSKNKGETDIETVFCFAGNADGLLIRHREPGFIDEAVSRVSVPITSGGNPNDHPTQTLKDLYTMKKLYTQIDGNRVVIAGHLSRYRAAISLLKGLSLFEDIDVTIVAPESGPIPQEIIDQVAKNGLQVKFEDDLRPLLKEPGFFYIGRPALEYAENDTEKLSMLAEYKAIGCEISHQTMVHAHREAMIAHPLPHNSEISADFYTDPRAIYEDQENNGLPMHMALQALQYAEKDAMGMLR